MYDVYDRFFGFERPPFDLVPDPDFLFLGESHDSALANLVMGIEAGKGFVVITGPIGTGKTTILRALLRRIGRTDRVCMLSQPETDTADLLRAILDGFGVPADDVPLVELRRRIRSFLAASPDPGILLVDEAHLLSEEALEHVRLLSNLEEDHRKLLQIVLSGQPELKTLLSGPRLKPLAQRIEMFYEIRPLSPEETGAYLQRRLAIANGNPGAEFTPEAAESIHVCTGGIPRLINLLADRTLLSAYVAGTRTLGPGIVAEAFEDLGEVTRAVMPGRPTRRRAKILKASPSFRRAPEETPAEARMTTLTELRHARRSRSAGPGPWVAGVAGVVVVLLGIVSFSGRLVRPESALEAATPAEGPADPAVTPSSAPPASATAAAVPGDSDAAPGDSFALHVASFRRQDKAEALATRMRTETNGPVVVSPAEVEGSTWYRVLVGSYGSREQARAMLESLRSKGEFSFVRTIRLSSPAIPVPTAPDPTGSVQEVP